MKSFFRTYPCKLLLAACLCFAGLSSSQAQNASSGAAQIDPDWEKIRDAQVQMLKKKEQELDRLKEELLSRAQPQVGGQAEAVQAELKVKEQDWLRQTQKYENEISLLRAKVEDQKREADALRSISGAQAKPNVKAEQDLSSVEAKLKEREAQVVSREKEVARMSGDFEKQLAEFNSKIKSEEDRLEAERREMREGRNALETEKRTWSEQHQALAGEAQALKESQRKYQDLEAKTRALAVREAAFAAKEAQLHDKELDAADREKRIAESQKQLVEERRQWQVEKSRLTADIEKRFTEADARLEAADKLDMEKSRVRAGYEKQLEELRNELRLEKDQSAQRELEWKEKARDAAAVQALQGKQIAELNAKILAQSGQVQKEADLTLKLEQVSRKLTDAEKERARLMTELSGLTVKMNQSASAESQSDAVRAELKEQNEKHARQEFEWKTLREEYEKQIADLGDRIAGQQSGMGLKEQELNQKLELAEKKADEAERQLTEVDAELAAFKSKAGAASESSSLEAKEKLARAESEITKLRDEIESLRRASGFQIQMNGSEAELADLKRELEANRRENQEWRQSKREVDQAWSEFVNRETQYQMEIESLQKQIASTSAAGGRDWNSEAKRVIEERRALSDEKTRLYRQLTQERQKLEQEKVEFLRHQREFDNYVKKEQARLGRSRG